PPRSPHLRPPRIVGQQSSQSLPQPRFIQLGFNNHLRRPSRHKRLRILALVVVSCLRKRHQNRRPPRRRQPRHRAGPATAKNQVCCSNLIHHSIEVRLHSHP